LNSGIEQWLLLGLGLVLLYILVRLVASPGFWTLAVIGTVVLGFAGGWNASMLLLLGAVVAVRWFVRGPSFGRAPRELRRARDPWGRTPDDPYFYREPPGPRADYH
jgi:hypothetical protein